MLETSIIINLLLLWKVEGGGSVNEPIYWKINSKRNEILVFNFCTNPKLSFCGTSSMICTKLAVHTSCPPHPKSKIFRRLRKYLFFSFWYYFSNKFLSKIEPFFDWSWFSDIFIIIALLFSSLVEEISHSSSRFDLWERHVASSEQNWIITVECLGWNLQLQFNYS